MVNSYKKKKLIGKITSDIGIVWILTILSIFLLELTFLNQLSSNSIISLLVLCVLGLLILWKEKAISKAISNKINLIVSAQTFGIILIFSLFLFLGELIQSGSPNAISAYLLSFYLVSELLLLSMVLRVSGYPVIREKCYKHIWIKSDGLFLLVIGLCGIFVYAINYLSEKANAFLYPISATMQINLVQPLINNLYMYFSVQIPEGNIIFTHYMYLPGLFGSAVNNMSYALSFWVVLIETLIFSFVLAVIVRYFIAHIKKNIFTFALSNIFFIGLFLTLLLMILLYNNNSILYSLIIVGEQINPITLAIISIILSILIPISYKLIERFREWLFGNRNVVKLF